MLWLPIIDHLFGLTQSQRYLPLRFTSPRQLSLLYTFLLVGMALWFSSGLIRLSSTVEPSGNEILRKKPVRSTPFLGGFCLFQNLLWGGDGSSLVLVFGNVWGTRKIKGNKLHCDGAEPRRFIPVTAGTASARPASAYLHLTQRKHPRR